METARTPPAAPVAVLFLARRPTGIRAGARGVAAAALAFKDVVRRLARDHSRASAGERRRRRARPPRRHRVLHPRLIVPHDVGWYIRESELTSRKIFWTSSPRRMRTILTAYSTWSSLFRTCHTRPNPPLPSWPITSKSVRKRLAEAAPRRPESRIGVQRRKPIAERHRRARGIDALVVVAKDVLQVFVVAGGVARLAAAAAASRGRSAAEELRDRVADRRD